MQHSEISPSTEELLVLEHTFWHGPVSRNQLMTLTGFSKTKVAGLITHLTAAGLLKEDHSLQSSGGRRSMGITLNPTWGYLIGIAIGDAQVKITLADMNFQFLDSHHHPLHINSEPVDVLQQILGGVDRLLKMHHLKPQQVLGTGMGLPGTVNPRTGPLMHSSQLPSWQGINIPDFFATKGISGVLVESDVNLMALGELWHHRNHHSGSQNETFLVVKLATEIRAGIVTQGKLFRGVHGTTGNAGHFCIDPDGPSCSCGSSGCLEVYAGAPALLKTARDNALRHDHVFFKKCLEDHTQITLEDLMQACQNGDTTANQIVQMAGHRVGHMVAALVNFFNPSHILIGGKVAHISPRMLTSICQGVYVHGLPQSTRNLRIDYTNLGERAVTYGAFALALLGVLRKGEIH
ncbi:ROK family protein [Deinococcus cellulosilyticus]|uniref:Sugar kinase n=1 Tax=Deinococcus cellulosilyticus (strain DSM 18568 / NBRC 106333 / KACC 11606 / 5516J-15) TaxID=1223518 RepID=A0A511MZ99_DEIC1|nr:ROK family protein [Deinococcus cellulosilyticus]GEM45477.1 sugar kinase [Deinococcus cellulosilyticus NBRC 106333 = KACC 11606]